MIVIAFILLTLLAAFPVYGGIAMSKNHSPDGMPWEPRPDRRSQNDFFFLDPDVGYDEKMNADMEGLNALMTGGGWIRAILQLILLGVTIAMVCMHPEWSWYARLFLFIPCSGLLAMAIYNLQHRK